MTDNSQYTAISIDIKHNRIRIFHSTLQTIGSPKYIQLLVSTTKKAVAIRGVDSDEPDAHKINRLGYKRDQVEIYSQTFIAKLVEVAGDIAKTGSYRLVGRINSEERIVYCPLSTMTKTQEKT